MAKSATLNVILSSDSMFRRIAFPLLLFASSAFRFNLFSLLYFTAMLISLVLPGTRKSMYRVPNFILSTVLIVVSAIGTLGQPFFQVTLATDYNNSYCSYDEKIWRQCGFIQLDVNAADVVRHLLPDIVVLVISILSLSLIVLISLTQMSHQSSHDNGSVGSDRKEGAQRKNDESIDGGSYLSIDSESAPQDTSSKRSSKSNIHSIDATRQSEKTPRSIFLLKPPKQTSFSYSMIAWNFMVVFLLWLGGMCTASVLNFLYFLASIYLSLCWALHLSQARFFIISQKVVVMLVTLYSAVHLMVLYLYQFQSAQDLVPRSSISARVLGLIGLVRTNCDNPTKLHVHDDLEWPDYLGPISVLLLYCMMATDVRYWLFYAKKHLQGQFSAAEAKHRNRHSPVDLEGSTHLSTVSDEERKGVSNPPTVSTRKKRFRWKRWFSHNRVAGWVLNLMRNAILKGISYLIEINFVLTLFSTMVWSLLFPSWPAFVLLMWSCVVWVTPRFNAKDAVYYSTPLLVLYAIVLLLMQYLYNLNLTEKEMESNIYAGLARYHGPPPGARVLTIALKSLFTASFMGSLREFVFLHKHQWQRYLNLGRFSLWPHDDTLEANLIPATHLASDGRLRGTLGYLKRYWPLVTTTAFLLVSLVGDVTIFKMIYMLFFLLFLLCYELFPHRWYTIMKPVWTILIFYAFVELVLIYTYQFSYVRHKWQDLFEDEHGHWTPEEILQSIGFFQVTIDDLSFTNVKDLFETSVPPALFVAVMALQLKYFSPLSEREETIVHCSIQVVEDSDAIGQQDDNFYEEGWNITTFYSKSKKYVVIFTEFCWRFLEIYLDDIIVDVTFLLILQQVSSTHVITLFILLCPLVGLKARHMWYPLLTLYIGTLIMLKMIYQVTMVEPHSFDLTDDCPAIDIENNTIPSPVSGGVFHYKYLPQESDPAWFGFYKVDCDNCDGFASYIKTHLAVVMLLACSYSIQRQQERYYRQHSIVIPEADKTALFWGITVDEMDKSIFKTIAYLISHIYDFYGLEICWCLLAINVAVRIDMYGVIYAMALGLLLVVPRRRLRPVWSAYLLVHGTLLIIQYLLVLNTPYGACIQDEREDKELPWSDVSPLELKRWLWLPLSSDNAIILNKNWLWADFITFTSICAESFNLRRRLMGTAVPGIFTQRFAFVSFASAEILLDHIKRVVFKHSYWVAIFIIMSAGVAQVSLLGVVYLIACFILLWFSGSFRLLSQKRLNRSWFLLLMVVWSVIMLKISLQIWTCVYHKNEFDSECVVIRLFNAECGARHYYGVDNPGEHCDDLPHHVGLWLDVFAFTAIVIQIVLFNTTYWNYIRQSTISKYVSIDPDWVAAALLEKINNNLTENRNREKRIKEKIRKRLLEVKEKYQTSILEHYLRAGVILPKNVKFIGEDKAMLHDQTLLVSKGFLDTGHAKLSPSTSSTSLASEHLEGEDDEFRSPGAWRLLGIAAELTDSALVITIEWLQSKSEYYYYLRKRLEVQQLEESQGLQHVPASLSDDIQLVPAVVVEEETGTALSTDDKLSHTPSADEVDHDHIVFHSKEKFSQTLKRISHRPKELFQALYHAVLANTDYICYLLIVINLMVNGSVLSLVYAALMFLWGLLSIPWPTKRFWLTLIVYTMFVILLKYGFQFQQVDWNGSPDAGLYWPHVVGIENRHHFFRNVVWDILLLIFLFVHRGLLQETGRWEIPGYFTVSSFPDTDGSSALKLIFKKRSELIEGDKEVESKANNDQDDYDDDDDDDDDDDEATESGFFIILIKSITVNVKHFFNQVLSPNISLQAHNYYTMSFIMDTISFIIIAIGFSSFGADEDEGLAAVADYIQQNNVPIPFLMMLFAHFISMVIDRAIYLRKSIAAKLIFLLFQLCAWHLWLLFILPASSVTDRAFTDNGFSQALYFFKSMYFILSAHQCVSGYPKRILGYFISKQYNIVASTIFTIYRSVPLLPELKEVMDWMFTPTSLELSHWLKVQEIWSLLYGIKNKRRWEKSDPRMLGDPESFLVKLFIGGGLLALLILLIWGPLLIISLINTTNVSNPPVEVSIHLSIRSFEPLLTMRVDEQDIKKLTDEQYNRLKYDYGGNKKRRNTFERHFKQEDFRYILFSGRSTALWQISPPSRIALEYLLQHESAFVPLIFSWTITREPETGLASEIVSGEVVKKLYSSNPKGNRTRQGFLNLLRSSNSTPVFISNLFPQYIYAPANGRSESLSALSRGRGVACQASLIVRNVTIIPADPTVPVSIAEEWWSLQQNSSHRVAKGEPNDVEFIIYSEKISKPEFSFIAGLGIIGLYVSVVLVIGSALRTYVAQLPSKINIDEIPDPDSLLELCDDIFYVREDGQLQEEEILVGRLFFTFRSSVRLMAETRWKQD